MHIWSAPIYCRRAGFGNVSVHQLQFHLNFIQLIFQNSMHQMTDKGKSSPISQFFNLKQDDVSKCHCLLCPSIISCGKPDKLKKFSSSSLPTYLRSKHAKQCEGMQIQMQDAKKKADTSAAKTIRISNSTTKASIVQPNSQEQLECIKVWDIKSSSAMTINQAIAMMIITDIEPYQVVEKRGYCKM